MALSIVVVWETLGWNGLNSVIAAGVVISALIVAAAVRALRGGPLLIKESRDPAKSFWLALGTFAVALSVRWS
jgi:hypothetical protein